MPDPMTALVGGSLVSGAASIYGSRQAAKSADRASDASIAESARQFDLVRQDTAAQRALGIGATGALSRLYGFGPVPGVSAAAEPMSFDEFVSKRGGFGGRGVGMVGGAVAAAREYQDYRNNFKAPTPAGGAASGKPDMSVFFESPDFQFNLSQGQQAIDRSLAARGRALSGAGVKEGERFASGLASQEFSNFNNRLLTMAGLGNAAVNTSANAGMTAAGQIGAAHMNAGNARASAYMSGAAGVNNAVQGGLSNFMLAKYLGGVN